MVLTVIHQLCGLHWIESSLSTWKQRNRSGIVMAIIEFKVIWLFIVCWSLSLVTFWYGTWHSLYNFWKKKKKTPRARRRNPGLFCYLFLFLLLFFILIFYCLTSVICLYFNLNKENSKLNCFQWEFVPNISEKFFISIKILNENMKFYV